MDSKGSSITRRLWREEHPQGSRSTSGPAHPRRGCYSVPAPFSSCVPEETKLIFHQSVVITALPSPAVEHWLPLQLEDRGCGSMVTGRGLQVYCQQGIQRPLPWVSLFDHLDPLSISPRCSVRAEQASLHQRLPGPLVLFWVWPMESPREDQRWEEKQGAIFCPLAPLWAGGSLN